MTNIKDKPGGRPAKKRIEKQQRVVSTKLTELQYYAIRKRAGEAGLRVSEYVRQAVENGAAVIVAEHPVELGVADGVPQVLVASGRRAWARMCANWFGNPAERCG